MSISFTHSRSSGSRAPAARGLSRAKAGFTLIELMVVLAIMTILTAVFLFQQQKFDSSTLLRTLGYSIALSVRQAQLYGSSVRQFDTTANGFQYSYGIYFSNSTAQYTLFADVNGDKVYSGSGEKVQTFVLSPGYTIAKVCGIGVNGTDQSCIPSGSGVGNGTNIGSLTIYFKRPDPRRAVLRHKYLGGQ